MKRRELFKRAAGGVLGSSAVVGALATILNKPAPWTAPSAGRRGVIRPPGAAAEDDFLARCIRCTRCSEVCEPGAIKLLPSGFGRLSGTPHIVPEETACTLCLKCGEACPTRALDVLFTKGEARMGTAVVDKRLCVSHNGTGICGACHTACPLKNRAIVQGAHNAPTVRVEACVGCGLCEEACIVDGDKAIRVLSPRGWA